MNFKIVYQAKTLEEFRALMEEFPSLASGSHVARAASPNVPALLTGKISEERILRDEWKAEVGRNFSFKKTMRANYASPLEALRAWKNGEMNDTSADSSEQTESEPCEQAPEGEEY